MFDIITMIIITIALVVYFLAELKSKKDLINRINADYDYCRKKARTDIRILKRSITNLAENEDYYLNIIKKIDKDYDICPPHDKEKIINDAEAID